VGGSLRPRQDRRYAGTVRLNVALAWSLRSEGTTWPAVELAARTSMSGQDVTHSAGRGDYQGNLTATKHLGALLVQGSTGVRVHERLVGWHRAGATVLDGSVSASYRHADRYEGLIDISCRKSMSGHEYTAAAGYGWSIHPQVYTSVLLRYRSNGRIQLQPGVMVSI